MYPYKYHFSRDNASPTGQSPGRLRAERARRFADTVAARAQWLPDDDRSLMLALYEHGQRVHELAAISGSTVRYLRCRARSILSRLRSDEFAFVVLYQSQWGPTTQAVARACILGGKSIRTAATSLGLTQYQVRRHRDLVLTLFQDSVAAGDAARRARAS
jgi:hypothetical protein